MCTQAEETLVNQKPHCNGRHERLVHMELHQIVMVLGLLCCLWQMR